VIDPARSFGRVAREYELGRPSWPPQAIDRPARELELGADSPVLDLGAGTGKLTSLLIRDSTEVFAIEPVAEMRSRLASLEGVCIAAGLAEAIPFADASFDGAFIAQAFHWFDGERALDEIRRVVRPRGRLGLVWNVRDRSVAWVEAVAKIVDGYGDAIRRHESGEWRSAFASSNGFTPLDLIEFPNPQMVTPAQVLDRVASTSFIARLGDGERAKVLRRVADVLRSDPEIRVRDRFPFAHVTRVYCCDRV